MKSIFMLLLAAVSLSVIAQQPTQDVVYLTNGSVIRGTIIKQVPNVSVSVQTADKSIFVFQFTEIEKIAKEIEEPVAQNAQDVGERKGYVGITLGAALPVGSFNDTQNGAAKTGVQFNLLNFGYLFSNKVGLAFTWFGTANPLDYSDLDFWGYGGLLAGPLASMPASDNIDIDMRLMIGYLYATSPDLGLGTDSGTALAFDLGTVVRYNFSKVVALLLTADFIGSNVTFAGYGFNQKILVFSINGGIAIRLK